MRLSYILLVNIFLLCSHICLGQVDSALSVSAKSYNKYLNSISNKADLYHSRVNRKTLQTLSRLSRWENKIRKMLAKVSPETSNKLFNSSTKTFANLYDDIKSGEDILNKTLPAYNDYLDKVSTGLNYAKSKDFLDKNKHQIVSVLHKLDSVNTVDIKYESVQKYIIERKKVLIKELLNVSKRNKYLKKINKEGYYYVETIKNYKEIFSDPKKIEEKISHYLLSNKSFSDYFKKNSALASLNSLPQNYGSTESLQNLQTRSSITDIINQKLSSSGPIAKDVLSKNLQAARQKLKEIQSDSLLKNLINSEDKLNSFKKNGQRSKLFFQRIEVSSIFQFYNKKFKSPASLGLGFNIGYKLDDKILLGVGTSYNINLGTIQKINIKTQGYGVRSFMDMRIKKYFTISGAYEINSLSLISNVNTDKMYSSALLGISKKLKKNKIQLFYDFLHNNHVPTSDPFVFRYGIILN